MTKEEYEKLLKSDYWRGYSYSLIKERDFTCEDCGRRFYNERNKLQVHHLVYRDVNPWSYRPDEVGALDAFQIDHIDAYRLAAVRSGFISEALMARPAAGRGRHFKL